jgi:energy-coupling factor transporter ATP-binding protein EcfA2
VEATTKYVKRAITEGWDASAMQVRPDGEGTKKDWNDLLKDHLDWAGDPDKAPLSDWAFDQYRYNGAITIAETARDKARLMADHKMAVSSFEFRHKNRLWSCKVSFDEESEKRRIVVEEIANCAFRLLYRERDEIADETSYFLNIDFPFEDRPVKARFSSAACANSGEFKKRMMAFAGMWSGTGEQLDRIMRAQTRNLKVVEPIYFTGYSATHRAWLLGDLAVREGRVVAINREAYFDFGKAAVKPRSNERMLDIAYDAEALDLDWVPDLWAAWGPKAMVALAFFVMSLFAVQIRLREKSIGFLEITGPPGSGKSTLVEFLWKLLGRNSYEGFDPNKATPAFLARSLIKVSNMPVGLIEGGRQDDKRGGHRQFDYNELLVLFNGRSPRGTGQKSNGVETNEPPFLGTIYLVQNERIEAIPAARTPHVDGHRQGRAQRDHPRGRDPARTVADGAPLGHHRSHRPQRGEVAAVLFRAVGIPRARHAHPHRGAAQRPRDQEPPPARRCRGKPAPPVSRHPPRMGGRNLAPDRDPRARPAIERGRRSPARRRFLGKGRIPDRPRKCRCPWRGKSLNQHRNKDALCAIQLPEFEARCRNAGLAPPNTEALKKLLRGSKSRKFVDRKKVNNPAGTIVGCWVFEQPAKAERII